MSAASASTSRRGRSRRPGVARSSRRGTVRDLATGTDLIFRPLGQRQPAWHPRASGSCSRRRSATVMPSLAEAEFTCSRCGRLAAGVCARRGRGSQADAAHGAEDPDPRQRAGHVDLAAPGGRRRGVRGLDGRRGDHRSGARRWWARCWPATRGVSTPSTPRPRRSGAHDARRSTAASAGRSGRCTTTSGPRGSRNAAGRCPEGHERWPVLRLRDSADPDTIRRHPVPSALAMARWGALQATAGTGDDRAIVHASVRLEGL